MKAWLTDLDILFPRPHDLSLLLGLLEDANQQIDAYWELLGLNPFAVQFRYELPGDGFPEFEQTADKVQSFLQHIERSIS